jgi:murein DD-endopeptidase MepM/ murein hydrolase activator NlpD
MDEKLMGEKPAPTDKPEQRNKGELLQQIGINMLMVGLLALLAYLAWQRFAPQPVEAGSNPIESVSEPVSEPADPAPADGIALALAPLELSEADASSGVLRHTNLETIIPTRPRVDVITYTVKSGDTLFTIAENYGLKPETLLWGNFEVLNDNPHLLAPNQVLNVLPVDGTYYEWKAGDTLGAIADFFKVNYMDIINYPGNRFDLTEMDAGGEQIQAGTWLIIPGGKRAIKDWGPPAISRANPASAAYYGEGHCGTVYDGAIGSGTFVWPTTDRNISGYHYNPGVHPAIDIGGAEGNAIYATDSGVVVFAGWSDYGYGYMIVIDHGNGWQSAYAHLSAVAVTCGQSVYQGGYIGAMGSTGNSSGPHLHFELAINGAKINPLDYLQ